MQFQFNSFQSLQKQTQRYDIFDFILCCFLATGFVFFKERTLYLDNAYLLFNILDSQSFRIEHYRFSAAIPQALAVFGAKFGFPIPVVASLLSFGYVLIHGVIYWFTKHRLNQKPLAIIYLMSLLLAMHENYFDMVTETRLALGFGVLYAALLLTQQLNNSQRLIWSIVVLILGTFSHPVFILYFVIVNLFYWSFKKRVFFQHFIIIGVLYFVKSALFGSSSYETGFYNKLFQWDIFSNSYLHGYMRGHIGEIYKLVIIVVYLTSAHMYRKGFRIELAAYLFSIAGTYFLLSLINAEGESHMMIQKSLLVLNFVCLYPMIYFYDQWINKLFLNALIPFVLLASFWTINKSAIKYTQRIDHLEYNIGILQKQNSKHYIHESQINHSTMLGTWALPYETMLLSSWDKPNSYTLFPISDTHTNHSFKEDTFNHVFSPDVSQDELNSKYFRFNQKGGYELIDSTFILD